MKPLPAASDLHLQFDYEPETGRLLWRPNGDQRFDLRYAGTEAGTVVKEGYRAVLLDGTRYFTHRVIWKMVTASDPEFIDHIDGDRLNNKLANLRSVTRTQNNRNRALQKNNRFGVPGVGPDRSGSKWVARIKRQGRTINLGTFASIEEAVAARRAAEVAEGYHPNHGRVAA